MDNKKLLKSALAAFAAFSTLEAVPEINKYGTFLAHSCEYQTQEGSENKSLLKSPAYTSVVAENDNQKSRQQNIIKKGGKGGVVWDAKDSVNPDSKKAARKVLTADASDKILDFANHSDMMNEEFANQYDFEDEQVDQNSDEETTLSYIDANVVNDRRIDYTHYYSRPSEKSNSGTVLKNDPLAKSDKAGLEKAVKK